jgi:hypothetical protein
MQSEHTCEQGLNTPREKMFIKNNRVNTLNTLNTTHAYARARSRLKPPRRFMHLGFLCSVCSVCSPRCFRSFFSQLVCSLPVHPLFTFHVPQIFHP